MNYKTFTSESVCAGHPDKICDQISDAVLDEAYRVDPFSRVAVECLATADHLVMAGEVTTKANLDFEKISRRVIKNLGYTKEAFNFHWQKSAVDVFIHRQSPEIAQGVDTGGAGDQGSMYGYACQETAELMPAPIMLAHRLVEKMDRVREEQIIPYLRPDGKSEVVIGYERGRPVAAEKIVLAVPHQPKIANKQLKADLYQLIVKPVLAEFKLKAPKKGLIINGTGRWLIGGPGSDTGETGRKIIVDTYGGMARHGGGCFCLAGNSLINTSQGLIEIENLKKEVKKGLLVKTDIHPTKTRDWYDNGEKATLKITTDNGYFLEGTENHRIRLIDRNGNYIWRRLDQIKVGDWVAIQKRNRLFGEKVDLSGFEYEYKGGTRRKNEFVFPKELTEDYAYLLGLLIGDGNCMNREGIIIYTGEEEQRENIQNLYKRLFGRKGKIYEHRVFMGGVELRAYLKFLGLGYKRSWEKEVPWSIFRAPKPQVAAFLRGLFDTDGGVRRHGRYNNFLDLKLTSSSLDLIKGVQQLLLNFGIITRINWIDNIGKKFQIEKDRKATGRRFVYFLRIKNVEGIRAFKSEIGFNLKRKQETLESISLEGKKDYFIIPFQRERVKKLWQKLTPHERYKDQAKIGRFTRYCGGKATKNLTYYKLKMFLEAYKRELANDRDFQYLQFLSKMAHFYDEVKEIESSSARTYDLFVPQGHTFIANGFVCHNSGKDPTKVDRSGAYACRFLAKNIVAAGLADRCEVKVAYVIGQARPLEWGIETFGTEKKPRKVLRDFAGQLLDLSVANILEKLDLRRPIYQKTACYGHFGRKEFPWEKTTP